MSQLERFTPPSSDHNFSAAGKGNDLGDSALRHVIGYTSEPELTLIDKDTNRIFPRRDADEYSGEVRGGLKEIATEILSLPSLEDGIDMGSVDGFREKMGSVPKIIKVLSPENFKHVRALHGSSDHAGGEYLAMHDIIIVKRDEELMELNGPGIMESLIVHELAHADQGFHNLSAYVTKQKRFLRRSVIDINPFTPRNGFGVSRREGGATGGLLEEAYAELKRGEFVTDVLKKPQGFAGDLITMRSSLNKYLYVNPHNASDSTPEIFVTKGAWGATILESLFERHPSLKGKMEGARHSAGGLRDFIHAMNKVKPGLHEELRDTDIDDSRSLLANLQERGVVNFR